MCGDLRGVLLVVLVVGAVVGAGRGGCRGRGARARAAGGGHPGPGGAAGLRGARLTASSCRARPAAARGAGLPGPRGHASPAAHPAGRGRHAPAILSSVLLVGHGHLRT